MRLPGAEQWIENVVFLESKGKVGENGIDVPLPVYSRRLQESVKTGDADIPPSWFLEGMAIVLAADPKFLHADSYRSWLLEDRRWLRSEMKKRWNESDPTVACFAAVLLQDDPDDSLAASVMASVLVDEPNAAERIGALCTQVLEDDEKDEDALWICASVAREVKLLGLAIQCLEKIQFSSNEERAHAVRETLRSLMNEWSLERAEILLRQQQYEEVVSLLGDLDPRDRSPYAWFLTGQAQQGMGLFSISKASLVKAIESGYQTPEAYNDLAIAYYIEENFVQALQVAEDGLARFPEEPRLLYNRLVFALQTGRTEEAQESLNRLRNVEISDPELRKSVDEILSDREV